MVTDSVYNFIEFAVSEDYGLKIELRGYYNNKGQMGSSLPRGLVKQLTNCQHILHVSYKGSNQYLYNKFSKYLFVGNIRYLISYGNKGIRKMKEIERPNSAYGYGGYNAGNNYHRDRGRGQTDNSDALLDNVLYMRWKWGRIAYTVNKQITNKLKKDFRRSLYNQLFEMLIVPTLYTK